MGIPSTKTFLPLAQIPRGASPPPVTMSTIDSTSITVSPMQGRRKSRVVGGFPKLNGLPLSSLPAKWWAMNGASSSSSGVTALIDRDDRDAVEATRGECSPESRLSLCVNDINACYDYCFKRGYRRIVASYASFSSQTAYIVLYSISLDMHLSAMPVRGGKRAEDRAVWG